MPLDKKKKNISDLSIKTWFLSELLFLNKQLFFIIILHLQLE